MTKSSTEHKAAAGLYSQSLFKVVKIQNNTLYLKRYLLVCFPVGVMVVLVGILNQMQQLNIVIVVVLWSLKNRNTQGVFLYSGLRITIRR